MKQKSTVLVIRIEPDVHERLQQRAINEERTQAALIRKAIRDFLGQTKSSAEVYQTGSAAFVGTSTN